MVKNFMFILFSVVILGACANDKSTGGNGGNESIDVPDSVKQAREEVQLDPEALSGVINSFSNPIEMAASVKESGAPFSTDYLSPVEKVDKYNTEAEKALGLGVLSADLGYLNIYEQTSTILTLLGEIKNISDDLGIGQFFDFNTLKDLAMSNTHLDSLTMVSTRSFNRMDQHLREEGRGKLSMLLLSGVWIEGQYLATQIVKKSNNKEIREMIGDQKVVLNELLAIIENFEHDPYFSVLIPELRALKNVYKDVKITYTPGEPKTVVKDGKLKIIQNETSKVEMNDATLDKVIKKSAEVRNKIIKL